VVILLVTVHSDSLLITVYPLTPDKGFPTSLLLVSDYIRISDNSDHSATVRHGRRIFRSILVCD
jgi:hypothetical protein